MLKYKILKEELIYRGKLFDVIKEDISYKNTLFACEIIMHPGAVVIIPVLDNNKLIFVKQFRPALKNFVLEFPAGTLKKNEEPILAAKRELKEETGFTAKKLKKILKIYPVPGYSTECMHIYIASKLKKGFQNLDKDEMLNVEILSLDAAFNLIKKGLIRDSKTVIGIFALKFKNFKTIFRKE